MLLIFVAGVGMGGSSGGAVFISIMGTRRITHLTCDAGGNTLTVTGGAYRITVG